jgi:hypothetical protein
MLRPCKIRQNRQIGLLLVSQIGFFVAMIRCAALLSDIHGLSSAQVWDDGASMWLVASRVLTRP